MLRRKTTLPMSCVFFVVWTVLLGGQGASSQDAAGVEWYFDTSMDEDSQFSLKLKDRDPPPRTCIDVKTLDTRTVVTLSDGLEVLCDTETDGGGWIVFQRRLSSDVDFNRNWLSYKYGFGDLKGNFWLGNEKIHRLTFQRQYQLRVDLTFNGKSYFAVYSNFRIFGEAEKYKLEVEGYSGNAGDSLIYHNRMGFSTKDRDNYFKCSALYSAAWWYNSCHFSNLNGHWGSKAFGKGLQWISKTTNTDTATSTEMKIRPLD